MFLQLFHRLTIISRGSILVLLLSLSTLAAQPGPDKSRYTLWNPTPDALLRDLAADRPDGTESPITVDAGRVQLETSFADYTRNDDRGGKTRTLTLLDSNIKLGLFHNTDLQFAFGAYSEERTRTPGTGSQTLNGFTDIDIRLKVNFWGNDGGETAFGVMPYLRFPSGTEVSSDHTEGGFIAMYAWNAAETWSLGFQIEVGFVHDAADDAYDIEFGHTAVLGIDLGGPWGAFLEYIGTASSDADTGYQAVFSCGLTFAADPHTQFDVGLRAGLTRAADDFNVFAGVTRRF